MASKVVKKWIGGGTGNKDVEAIVDPLGVGDAFFGDDPEMADTSDAESARNQAVLDWKNQMPTSYREEQSMGNYRPELLDSVPQLGDSAMGGISTNPKYDEYRMAALAGLEEQAQGGLSAQDKADLARLEGDVNRQNAGRVGAIQQNMAARGVGGSGMELVAQMQGAQDATQRQAQGALDKAAMAQQGQRDATAKLGAMGSQMQGQDFGQQAQQAQAKDAISRFNTQNSVSRAVSNNQMANDAAKANLQNRQGIESRNTAGSNNFDQSQFQNQGGISQMRYNQATGDINGAKQDYQNAVDGKQKKKDGIINFAGQAAGAAAMFSDERMKKDVSPISDGDIEEFLESLSPKQFRYKNPSNGPGDRVGVMAQDMEQSKIGDKIVNDSPDGKSLDINNVIGALLDSVALLHKKSRG